MYNFIEKYITTEPRKWLFCVVTVLAAGIVGIGVVAIPCALFVCKHFIIGIIVIILYFCVGLGTGMYCDGVMD